VALAPGVHGKRRQGEAQAVISAPVSKG
jgi:hypothetical protein